MTTTTKTPASFPEKLINEPTQLANPGKHMTQLGPLQYLLGTWTNQVVDTADNSPYSYNLMPLPKSVPTAPGYILKNFKYYEEITFSAISGAAPNRGGDYTQTANVIFYEQRVYFAEGPDKDQLVHAENGSWLYLETGKQLENAYNNKAGTGPYIPNSNIKSQPISMQIAKQISVPHGNSVLAMGTVESKTGAPTIPNYGKEAYPAGAFPGDGVDTSLYATKTDVAGGNPHPSLNGNPNEPIQNGSPTTITEYIKLDVDSNVGGSVTNIPFEMQKADVTDYKATYWLQTLAGSSHYNQLAYTQTIVMKIPINGEMVDFPHVTCNVLTKKT